MRFPCTLGTRAHELHTVPGLSGYRSGFQAIFNCPVSGLSVGPESVRVDIPLDINLNTGDMTIRLVFLLIVVLGIEPAVHSQSISPEFSLSIDLKQSVVKPGSFVDLVVTTKNISSHEIAVGQIVGSAGISLRDYRQRRAR